MLSKIDVLELKNQVSKLLDSKTVYVGRSYDPEQISVWCESFKFIISYDEHSKKFECLGKITEVFYVSKPIETEVIKRRFNNVANLMNEVYFLILDILDKTLQKK